MAILVGPRIRNITNATTVGTTTTGFTVHTFSTPGATTFTAQGSGIVEVLVVGGGGGGGAAPGPDTWNGGAGGGSVLYAKNVPLIDGVSYTATVGSVGASGTSSPLGFGGTSILTYNNGNITSPGGGYGARHASGGYAAANNPVGSGGGGSRNFPSGGLGVDVIGLGFGGGAGPNGGGGGGAGGAGQPASTTAFGGIGVSYSITGVSTYYGGGGAGTPIPHPTSFPTMFGWGKRGNGSGGNPGCIIIRYQG